MSFENAQMTSSLYLMDTVGFIANAMNKFAEGESECASDIPKCMKIWGGDKPHENIPGYLNPHIKDLRSVLPNLSAVASPREIKERYLNKPSSNEDLMEIDRKILSSRLSAQAKFNLRAALYLIDTIDYIAHAMNNLSKEPEYKNHGDFCFSIWKGKNPTSENLPGRIGPSANTLITLFKLAAQQNQTGEIQNQLERNYLSDRTTNRDLQRSLCIIDNNRPYCPSPDSDWQATMRDSWGFLFQAQHALSALDGSDSAGLHRIIPPHTGIKLGIKPQLIGPAGLLKPARRWIWQMNTAFGYNQFYNLGDKDAYQITLNAGTLLKWMPKPWFQPFASIEFGYNRQEHQHATLFHPNANDMSLEVETGFLSHIHRYLQLGVMVTQNYIMFDRTFNSPIREDYPLAGNERLHTVRFELLSELSRASKYLPDILFKAAKRIFGDTLVPKSLAIGNREMLGSLEASLNLLKLETELYWKKLGIFAFGSYQSRSLESRKSEVEFNQRLWEAGAGYRGDRFELSASYLTGDFDPTRQSMTNTKMAQLNIVLPFKGLHWIRFVGGFGKHNYGGFVFDFSRIIGEPADERSVTSAAASRRLRMRTASASASAPKKAAARRSAPPAPPTPPSIPTPRVTPTPPAPTPPAVTPTPPASKSMPPARKSAPPAPAFNAKRTATSECTKIGAKADELEKCIEYCKTKPSSSEIKSCASSYKPIKLF